MKILGLSHPYSWNTAAALLIDGNLVAFAEEERFLRLKHAPRTFPKRALDYCLKEANVDLKDIDHIAIGMETKWAMIGPNFWPLQPLRFTIEKVRRNWREISYGNTTLPFKVGDKRVSFLNHHKCHVASSFFLSGFHKSNFISLDGSGGGESGMIGWGEGTRLHVLHRVTNAGSWGALYERITSVLGFVAHSEEGKTMGLAAYGTPDPDLFYFIDWNQQIPKIDRIKRDAFLQTLTRRTSDEPITQEHRNLAATVQFVLEKALLQITKYLVEITQSRSLCMSGGVALNCSANGKLLCSKYIDDIYIQPASSDAGVALGAAVLKHVELTNIRPSFVFNHAHWGPEYSNMEIEALLKEAKVSYIKCANIYLHTAKLLVDGKTVGWLQGRMEVGPRALGGRSILADPAIKGMKDKINVEIKHREIWRPFAPSMLKNDIGLYVKEPYASPFMNLAFQVNDTQLDVMQEAVHVDNTARVHGVTEEANPHYYKLISEFKKLTGRGVILNTSFNIAGEPIVCSPLDALRTFYCCGLDVLVLGDFVVAK